MITNQILKTLLENASISESDGLTFKEIQQCLPEPITVKMLQSLRDKGMIKNSMKRNLNTWWLTTKGAETALVDIEEPQYPTGAGGNIDPDTDDSMLNNDASVQPEYEQANEYKQNTDAFINAINEDRKPIETIEFIVIDQHGEIVHDSFETISDAIHKAHDLAANTGSEYHVERMSTQRMGSVKLITATQWVAAA
jgi:hypothetical protein